MLDTTDRTTAIALTVNGQPVTLSVEPRMHLADALREGLNLTGTHLGCEQGVCGACTVLVDGKPQRSCITWAVECAGTEVTTIEGFDADPTMAALREAFSEHHALQCGFCTPGMLITSRDIVLRLGEQPEARVREELSGNLCRCTGYMGIVAAVGAVAAGRAPQPAAAAQPVAERQVPAGSEASVTESAAPAVPSQALSGATQLEEHIRLAAAPDAAWAALRDLRAVASCLPGAVLESHEGERVTGRVQVALGPVKANLAGEGQVTLDETARKGKLFGRGRDRSGTQAEGEVGWQVLPTEGGGSEILVQLSWRLAGPLAQFARAGLVQDLVRRLAQEFARNLDALVAGQAPPLAKPVGLWSLIWGVIRTRVFGR